MYVITSSNDSDTDCQAIKLSTFRQATELRPFPSHNSLSSIFQRSPSKTSRVSNISSTTIQLKPKLDSRQNSKVIEPLKKKFSKKNSTDVLLDNDHETNLSSSISLENATNEEFLREENLSTSESKSLLEAYPWISKTKDYRNSSTFSFGHGVWALAHATQKISLTKILQNDDKENLWQVQLSQQPRTSHFRKLDRLYRPRESSNFNRLKNTQKFLRSTYEKIDNFSHTFFQKNHAESGSQILSHQSKIKKN